MNKTFAAAGAAFVLLLGGGSAAAAVPDHQDAPHIDRYERQLRDVPVVASALEEGNQTTVRIAGADRYETAALISQQGWGPDSTYVVFLASGLDFPDALALSPTFGGLGPLLLVDQGLPQATYTELLRLHPCLVVVVGGTAKIPQWLADQAGTLSDENQAKCAD